MKVREAESRKAVKVHEYKYEERLIKEVMSKQKSADSGTQTGVEHQYRKNNDS